MSFDFSTLITDRTQADVTAKNDKGTYNADDLNRVTAAMEYLDDALRSYGYVTGYQRLEIPHTDESAVEYDAYTWYEYDLPTKDLMEIYLANVMGLYEVILSEPELPTTMAKLTYQGANQIEQALATLNTAIKQIVAGFARSNAFTFWSGNRPFPTAQSDRGRNWAQLDAMETSWSNWQLATWYLLLYGNLKAEGDVV